MRIILASNSPRRKELLSQIGLNFEITPSDFEENSVDMPPEELVQHFAYMKAKDIFDKLKQSKEQQEDTLIIGSDTIVYLDNIIMGKPQNEQEAFSMLKRLSDKAHYVMSGLSVFQLSSGKSITEYEVTRVKIKSLSDKEILNYIRTGEPMDKAGSYAIQGIGSIFVEGIEGCYFNVMGLPIFRLCRIFEHFGVAML